MLFPEEIPTREVRWAGSGVLESAEGLIARVAVKSSRALQWVADDFLYETTGHSALSTAAGQPVTIELPRSDVNGWKDPGTNELLVVTEPGQFVNTYEVTITYVDERGRTAAIPARTYGPFPLLDGDGPVDLGSLLPVGTREAGTVLVPDSWTESIATAERLTGEAAQHAADAEQAARDAIPTAQKGAAEGVAELDADGVVPDPQLPYRLSLEGLSLTVTATTRKVWMFFLWGQSNMAGRGTPFSSVLDPAHPRIFQYGYNETTLTPATEPLKMHDLAVLGIGPGLQFARNLLSYISPDDIIVLVPSAHGGTVLSTDSAAGWRAGIAGGLTAQAIAQGNAAMAAAAAAWPGAKIVKGGVLWLQGEGDGGSGTTGSQYRTDLHALVAHARTQFNEPGLPFIAGQMVAEGMASGTKTQINAVHSLLPYEVPRTGFVPGPRGMNIGDGIHYNAQAHRTILAPGYLAEWLRIDSGRAPQSPRYDTTFLSADFTTRADTVASSVGASAVGNADTGQPFSIANSGGSAAGTGTTAQILAGRVKFAGGTSGNGQIRADAGASDGELTVLCGAVGARGGGVLIRGVDSNDFIQLKARTAANDNRYALISYDEGQATTIHSFATISADNDVIKVVLKGTSITITINGAETWTGPVTIHQTGTLFGFVSQLSLQPVNNSSTHPTWRSAIFQSASIIAA